MGHPRVLWYHLIVTDPAHLQSAIAYVERHPHKEGLPDQRWDFVQTL